MSGFVFRPSMGCGMNLPVVRPVATIGLPAGVRRVGVGNLLIPTDAEPDLRVVLSITHDDGETLACVMTPAEAELLGQLLIEQALGLRIEADDTRQVEARQ